MRVLFNGPDESPLVVRIYGDTLYVDPGEPEPDFAADL